MSKRSRRDLDHATKIQLLERYRELPPGTSQREAAQFLKISRGLLRNLLRDEEKIRSAVGSLQPNGRKRQRNGKNQRVEASLWKWFQFAKSRNIPVNGPILCQKAEQIAQSLQCNDFKSTDGWFTRWKRRHGLSFSKLHREDQFRSSVDINAEAPVSHQLSGEEEERVMLEMTKIDGNDRVVENEKDDDAEDGEERSGPTPSEMERYVCQLRIGLERRGFQQMKSFDEWAWSIMDFVQRHNQKNNK